MADEDAQPAAEKPPELKVCGITEREYIAWKHHPVSRLVLRFYRDFRDDLRAAAMQAWEERPLDRDTDNEMRARVKTLNEIADLPFSSIAMFYTQMDETAGKTKPTNEDEEDSDDAA